MPRKPSLAIKEVKGRNRPFCLHVSAGVSASGKRERRYFASSREARTARQLEEVRIANSGVEKASLPPGVLSDVARAQRLLEPHGISILDAVRELVEAREALGPIGGTVVGAVRSHVGTEVSRARSCTFAELIAEFVDLKRRENVSVVYLKQIRAAGRAFEADLGALHVHDITPKVLEKTLRRFSGQTATFKQYHRILRALFNHGIHHGHLSDNPVLRVKPPKEGPREVGVLNVIQATALLEAARSEEPGMLAYFAIGLFAGLRPTEIRRLDWSSVDFERGEIFVRVKRGNEKERVGRSVPMEPNLRRWLELCPEQTGVVVPSSFRDRFERVRSCADERLRGSGDRQHATLSERWHPDCMRHTTASCWDARDGSVARSALRLGHTESVHMKHYHHPLTRQEAESFWALIPS